MPTSLHYNDEFCQAAERIRLWRWDPILFVNEALRLPERGADYYVTDQQKQALVAARDLALSKTKAAEYRKLDLRLRAGEISKSRYKELKAYYSMTKEEWDLSKKVGISIMSGRGPGKTTVAAWLMWWLLVCFKDARLPCTAPKKQLLKDNLWGAMVKWGKGDGDNPSTIPLFMQPGSEWFEILGDRIYMKTNPIQEALARTINLSANKDTQAETFRGYHAPTMIYIIDEATGVPDPVFQPLEASLTEPNNWIFIISNPTRTSGYAAGTHLDELSKDQWIRISWNCEESERVKPEFLESQRRKYGVDSDNYRVEVLGKFPKSNPDSYIARTWVEEAMLRKIDPKLIVGKPRLLGVDVALGGSAYTVVALRQGFLWERFYRFKTNDARDLAQIIKQYFREWFANYLFLDVAGMGRVIYDDHFKDDRTIQTEQFSAAFSAADKDTYYRLGDEAGMRLRSAFEQGLLQIPNDDILKMELTSRGIVRDASKFQGKIKLESKREMKEKGLPSPDIMDAFTMTYMYPDSIYEHSEDEDGEVSSYQSNQNTVTGY